MQQKTPPERPPAVTSDSENPESAERIAALRSRTKTTKHHAARKTRASALALSMLTTGGLAGYMAYIDQQASDPLAEIAAATADLNSAVDLNPEAAQTIVPDQTDIAEPTSTSTNSTYTDGDYVGSSVATEWGPVQVSVSLANDQIVAVDVLAIPDSDRKSQRINSTAGPALVSDTLTAQSAEVSIVSGATYTSRAYQNSLQSALDEAAAALAEDQVR